MRRRQEAGAFVSVWALIVTAGAFTVLLGLVIDGGTALNARREAARTAEQAARVGADQLETDALRTGQTRVDPQLAASAAHQYLRANGADGRVSVDGGRVSVTVVGRTRTQVLGAIGIGSFGVNERATAVSIDEQEDTP